MKIIFISGIHGSGKSTLGSNLSKALQIPCFSASELIYSAKNAISPIDKRVLNIDANQKSLLDALQSIQENLIILEGHTCLIDSQNIIKRINLSVFKALDLVCVIFVKTDVQRSAIRLHARDGYKHSIKTLNRLQNEEWKYLQKIRAVKDIPIYIFDPTMDVTEFSANLMKDL